MDLDVYKNKCISVKGVVDGFKVYFQACDVLLIQGDDSGCSISFYDTPGLFLSSEPVDVVVKKVWG
jgi:hypothetical protein